MNPQIMASIRNGPNHVYADEYARVNHHINELSVALAAVIEARGFRSKPLAASDRTDTINIKGEFPHKTAATRAGLGWVGRHSQLITRRFESWVRLGTVFTDIELPCGPPIERNFCGHCKCCVEACPAKALKGNAWYPGLPREEILDALTCDQWKRIKDTPRPKGIYQIKNKANGKILIGSSVNLPAILNRCKAELKMGSYRNMVLQKEWEQFGSENFEFKELEILEPADDPNWANFRRQSS